MSYSRPKLVMALGSSGGYRAFLDIMQSVDPELKRNGAIYFLEHVGPSDEERDLYKEAGIDMDDSLVDDGRVLDSRLHFQPHVYEVRGQRDYVHVIAPDSKNTKLLFRQVKPDKRMLGFSYNIRNAFDAGYADDIMLIFMSGMGDDGLNAFDYAKERKSKILIQEPETAIIEESPMIMMRGAIYSKTPHLVLEPGEIGNRINNFMF